MANPNPAHPGPGGPGRNPNSGKNPQQPKVMLKAYANVNLGANNTYLLFIEASAFLSGQPMSGRDVTLKEGIKTLDAQNLDVNGEALLRATGSLNDQEQVKAVRICLTGSPEEKNLTVTIPAIKKVVHKKKTITVATIVTPDTVTNTAEVVFSCLVSEDGGVICANQQTALQKGVTQIETKATDGNGRVTFKVTEPIQKVDTTVMFRIILPGLVDEVEANVVIPAAEAKTKEDKDPESIILRRYHDGCGNFKVKIRVLKTRGAGLKDAEVSIWYKGGNDKATTDANGEAIYNVPGVVNPGDNDRLVASVSGIADEATVDIKRRKLAPKVKAFSSGWWLGTNNGRAFILVMTVLLVWVITFIVGTGEPKVNHRMFNNDEAGLSKAEQFYNQSAARVDSTYVIEPAKPWSTGRIAYWGWLAIITILILIYAVFSLREEIAAGIEDGLEKLFDKSYAKSGDPFFERMAKLVGSYHVARKADSPVGPNDVPLKGGAHPSLMTLFKLDLLSDTLVSIVPAILKRIF